MAAVSDYTDVREGLPRYKSVPCRNDDCEKRIYATVDFRPDDWWCDEHLPARLDMSHLHDKVTVRL